MAEAAPYTGSNLGPLSRSAPAADDWSAFPVAPAESAKADNWDIFPKAHGILDTAIDAGKSLAAGVGKGMAGIVGLPGLAAEYGARGIDTAAQAVGSLVGADVPRRENRDPTYGPDAAQRLIEEGAGPIPGTGEFHKPETTAGHFAETVGEFLPAALTGPGGIGRRLLLQGVAPGVASEAAGQATKGTGFETPARIAAGLVTGVGGAMLSRPSAAQNVIRGQMGDGITEAHVNAAEQLVRDAQQRGINLSYPEALSQVVGRPVLTETQRVIESSPETRPHMQAFYGERPQQFDAAALDALQPVAPGTINPSSIGRAANEAAEGHLTDVRQTINRAAEPYYQAAEQVILTPQEMAQVRAIPNFDAAARAVRAAPDSWRVAHLPDESVGFLNAVKKYFDTAAENASSQFNPMRNHGVQSSHEMSASAVRQVGEAVSPDYQTALEIGRRGREQYLQPLMDGPLGKLAKKPETKKAIEALFPENPLPNSHHEISDAVGVLARRNPWAARQLVRAHLEQTFNEATRGLQSGANQFGPANFAKALVGNVQQRENLRAAIQALPQGDDLWRGFERFLEIAEATRYRQTVGSKTAFNEAERRALAASNLGREVVKTGASPGKWWTLISDKLSSWQLGRNLDELAQIFTSPDSADLLRRIVRMPPASNEAGVATARLIAQAAQSARKPTEPRRP